MAETKYRTVVLSPGLMINQRVGTYEEASIITDFAFETLRNERPLNVAIYGPHARRPELGEVRLWSFEVK